MEDGDLDGVAKEVHTEDSKEQSERTDAIISSVAVQLCKAVGAMHSKNLIHRDIKPKNIFLNKKAHTIKLGDFGVVYAIEHANPDERGITGTVDYMPPEGFSTDAVPNKGYDLYAIGGVLYNLRTGKAPIYVESEDDTYLKRMYNKATYDVPSIREQLGDKYEPSYLDDIIMTLLKRNPEDRTHVTIEGKEYLLESAVDISHAIEELAQKYNVPTDVL
jgi:serine/threonine-protein kinase